MTLVDYALDLARRLIALDPNQQVSHFEEHLKQELRADRVSVDDVPGESPLRDILDRSFTITVTAHRANGADRSAHQPADAVQPVPPEDSARGSTQTIRRGMAAGFQPIKVSGRPLSEDIIRERR
jgi:hypothetical protein